MYSKATVKFWSKKVHAAPRNSDRSKMTLQKSRDFVYIGGRSARANCVQMDFITVSDTPRDAGSDGVCHFLNQGDLCVFNQFL